MDERDELICDLIGVTYTRLVERLARQAFDTGRTDDFLTIVNRVCADCGVELLNPNLVDHLADGFDDPYGQFLLRVHVNTAALFHVGAWQELLGALRPIFDPRSLGSPRSGGRFEGSGMARLPHPVRPTRRR